MDCDDSVNKILYLAHTGSEGLPAKYFDRFYKMPEVLADKIKHFVNLGKDENQPEGEAYARRSISV